MDIHNKQTLESKILNIVDEINKLGEINDCETTESKKELLIGLSKLNAIINKKMSDIHRKNKGSIVYKNSRRS